MQKLKKPPQILKDKRIELQLLHLNEARASV